MLLLHHVSYVPTFYQLVRWQKSRFGTDSHPLANGTVPVSPHTIVINQYLVTCLIQTIFR